MDKYLSIITNFGCHYQCPYCIVKENNLHIPETTLQGLNELEDTIKSNSINIISVSGGGDPLHNYEMHKNYYDSLFEILNKVNIPMEMHTSYIDTSFPLDKCSRVVYHIRHIAELNNIERKGNEIVRVVFVVTEDFSRYKIDLITKTVKESADIDELSFRQMVDGNYNNTHYCEDYLTQGHKKDWFYITQCDYNLYYFENKVTYSYKDFEKY